MAMSVRSDGSWQLLFHLLKVPSNKTYSRETTTFTAPHLHLLSFSRWREAQITWEDGKRKSSRRLNWTTTPVLIKWLNSLMDVFTSQTTTSVSSAVAVCFVLTLAWRSYQAEHDDRLSYTVYKLENILYWTELPGEKTTAAECWCAAEWLRSTSVWLHVLRSLCWFFCIILSSINIVYMAFCIININYI